MNAIQQVRSVLMSGVNLNELASERSVRESFPRDTFARWLYLEMLQQGSRADAECVRSALGMMATRELPVSASDADDILGLTPGSTLFFNHGGTVSADAVLDELARRAAAR